MQTAHPPIPPWGHHPVIQLPETYQVRDFTQGHSKAQLPFSVGKYNEDRRRMYHHDLFQDELGGRTIHMGIDFGAPVGTALYAIDDGIIYDMIYRDIPGDYGTVLITQHQFQEKDLWCLYGHLSKNSIQNYYKGQKVIKGQEIAYIGDESENGGWPPHLHFQLSWIKPHNCDLPGVVHKDQHTQALSMYPDPQMILGRLYLD